MSSSPERFVESPESSISRVWRRPLPDLLSEPTDRQDYVAFEPTPVLNMVVNEHYHDVQPHQQEVAAMTEPLFGVYAPEDVPLNVREMIELDHVVGKMHRDTKNINAWFDWSERDIPLPRDLQKVKNKILRGEATPTESLTFLSQADLASVELTKVTHPYGYRMENVLPARAAVRDAFIKLNNRGISGKYRPSNTYRKISISHNIDISGGENDPEKLYTDGLQIVSGDRKVTEIAGLNGLMITYKRDMGSLVRADGRRIDVIERQSAAFRIDENVRDLDEDFRKRIIAAMPKVSYNTDWLDEYGIRDEIEHAIQSNVDADYLVPLSTMTYATLGREQYREIGGLALFGTMTDQSGPIYLDGLSLESDSPR